MRAAFTATLCLCAAVLVAGVTTVAPSEDGLGAPLPLGVLAKIRGASDTNRQLVGASTTCGSYVASQTNGGNGYTGSLDCYGCTDIGPPIACISCKNETLGDVTQQVNGTGNFVQITDVSCGAQSLGTCQYGNGELRTDRTPMLDRVSV
jgi:hypothetical protein